MLRNKLVRIRGKHLCSTLALLSLVSCVNRLARNPAQAQIAEVPDWVNFPGEEWQTITPAEAGLDPEKFNNWVQSRNPQFGKGGGGQQPPSGGVVIARGGYILHTWGDPDFKWQSASLGKGFTRLVLRLAVDEGLIGSENDLIKDYWTGAGQLNGPHKVLTNGHHTTLAFSHLKTMQGGFPVTNGQAWQDGQGIPSWANWSCDDSPPPPAHCADWDNYAHVQPGTQSIYSSGGYWRLSQALTAIWNRDLKEVLDEKIMSKIGIPADRWDWFFGEDLLLFASPEYPEYYRPSKPAYPKYLDPPFLINGIRVRGGPGWVRMSALDFARVGLFFATEGVWRGEKLISSLPDRYLVGIGAHTAAGWGVIGGKDGYFSFGKVSTGFNDPTSDEMASWITGPVNIAGHKLYLPLILRSWQGAFRMQEGLRTSPQQSAVDVPSTPTSAVHSAVRKGICAAILGPFSLLASAFSPRRWGQSTRATAQVMKRD